MRIGNLDQHCGECTLIEYCGKAYGYAICTDGCSPVSEGRFADMEEKEYLKIAETAPYEKIDACKDCDALYGCELCEHDDERKDYEGRQVADYVAKMKGYDYG